MQKHGAVALVDTGEEGKRIESSSFLPTSCKYLWKSIKESGHTRQCKIEWPASCQGLPHSSAIMVPMRGLIVHNALAQKVT